MYMLHPAIISCMIILFGFSERLVIYWCIVIRVLKQLVYLFDKKKKKKQLKIKGLVYRIKVK